MFFQGMPTLDEVHRHATEHPCIDSAGRDHGALWLCIDPQCPTHPQLIHLRPDDTTKQVMLQNGMAFWQPLSECKWAARAKYMRCTTIGMPF